MSLPDPPPAASVRQPDERMGPRPRTVVFALACLWAAVGIVLVLGVSDIATWIEFGRRRAISTGAVVKEVFVQLVTIGMPALAAVKFNDGRGWVRWLYAAYFLPNAAWAAWLSLTTPDALGPWRPFWDSVVLFSWIAEASALALMFAAPSREWLRTRTRA